MKIKLPILLLLVLSFFSFPSLAFATANFTTDYHVTYNVDQNGTTHAVIDGTLTNTSSQYYASSYKMQVGFETITNVKATDPNGPINPVVTKVSDGYTIDMTFNKKAVGLGDKLPFTLTFDTPAVAKRYGKIWEINIPGLSNPADFSSFTVQINVPPSFGQPRYIKPTQPSTALTFTKEQLGKSGISIAFGEKQLYAFHLTYHLTNSKPLPVKTEIALPPSTNYQDIFITNISPLPSNVRADKDGNWLAEYNLLPSQQLEVTVQGDAQVQLTPMKQEVTQAELAEYLKPQQYWGADQTPIKTLATELKTPEAIYHYVVKTLHYDFARVTDDKPRLGAVAALQNPNSAVCREFTDLFIALARAAGIPAREVDGFAYTENPKQRPLSLVRDILHAWPEYYDVQRKTWVMVDPTWSSTTGGIDYFHVLDFDHVAFVVKGRDSNAPIPAGGYKFAGNESLKDVNVTFADVLPDKSQDIDVTTSLEKTTTAGLPIHGKVTIKNNGSSLIPAQALYVSSKTLTPSDQMYTVDSIPPFGKVTVDVGFHGLSFLTNTTSQFTIRLADQTSTHEIKVVPFFLTPLGIGGILFGILTTFILIIAFKVRRLHLSR